MSDAVADHRTDDTQVIHKAGDVREQLADLNPTLSALPKFPRRLEQVPNLAWSKSQRSLEGKRLSVVSCEKRLRIERIHV